MNLSEQKQRLEAAHKILQQETTTLEKCQSLLTLASGINPRIDAKLESFKKTLSGLSHLQKGEIIDLSVEALPEETEKEKKRKKALLLFLKHFRELEGEIERVKGLLEKAKEGKVKGEEIASFSQIAALAKGPFGIITALAVIIAVVAIAVNSRQTQPANQIQQPSPRSVITSSPTPLASPTVSKSPSPRPKIKVITFNGKKIPLDQLEVRTGPDCTNSPQEAPHYHAKNNQFVTALDGTQIADPGACAYGKVAEVAIEEVEGS